MAESTAAAQAAPRGKKTFVIIWLGQVVSMIGSGLTSFALGVWIYEQTHQATPFGLTVLFGNLPRILLAPLAGSLADRWNRRMIMILSDCGNALITLLAAILLFMGELQVYHIYLIALVGSVFSAFQEPAYTSSITMLVPKKDLARAGGLLQMGQSVELLISPLLAGVLFVAIGLHGIMLIDFVTFFFAIGALLAVRIPQPPIAPVAAGEGGLQTVWRDTRFGWNYLRERAGLLGILLYFALVNFLLNFAAVLMVPLVLTFGSPTTLGVVQTVAGVGMLAGSIAMSVWGGPQRRIRAVIGFITTAAFGLMVAGSYPHAAFVALGLFILMGSIPLGSAPSQAIFQTKVAPEVQGRVFAFRSLISRSMMPLAFLLAGPLADRVFEPAMRTGSLLANSPVGQLLGSGPGRGIGLMFVLSGLTLVFASLLAYSNPRIRHVEEELPDVLPDATPEAGEAVVDSSPYPPAAETDSLPSAAD